MLGYVGIAIFIAGWLVTAMQMRRRGIGKFRRHLMGFCAGVSAGIVFIVIIGKAPETPDRTSPSMAFIQCKGFVEDRLKSPASAEFPTLDFQAFPRGQDTYAIRSYVDSQNSFGAKIRTDFFCEVEWNGKDHSSRESWKLRQLELTERG